MTVWAHERGECTRKQPFEREDARVAARLRASLNSHGTPIGAYAVLLSQPVPRAAA